MKKFSRGIAWALHGIIAAAFLAASPARAQTAGGANPVSVAPDSTALTEARPVRDDAPLAGPRLPTPFPSIAGQDPLGPVSADTGRRPRAVEYSNAYFTRLTIHRYASYAELPLFAAEYVLGEKLLRDDRAGIRHHSTLHAAHVGVAAALGTLFAVNTVTGVWNLWEARHDPAGRPRRMIHAVSMLAADAGFAWAGAIAGGAKHNVADANHHRAVALTSFGIATASTLMMWLWKQ